MKLNRNLDHAIIDKYQVGLDEGQYSVSKAALEINRDFFSQFLRYFRSVGIDSFLREKFQLGGDFLNGLLVSAC